LYFFKIRLHIDHWEKKWSWDTAIDLNDLLKSYVRIEQRQRDEPVALHLPPPPEKSPIVDGFRPHKQQFFFPPLQQKRNERAYDLLPTNGCEKLAILGCGELSFERYAPEQLADNGIRHVVSVDIEGMALSSGIESLSRYLSYHGSEIMAKCRKPVHFEIYKGDALTPSPVLSNVDVAISLEVIEHMPLAQATELLKCVLYKVRPKLFIISTPNFDYNKVLNVQTPFRHDEHHFEFTRIQFKEWLSANVVAPYKYEISFVGILNGHEHLGGATQFARIWREDGISGCVITEVEGTYQKVGDFVYRTSSFRLLEAVVVGAFRSFIEDFPFDPQHLTSDCILRFWRIPTRRILECRPNPTIEVDEYDAMVLLTALFDRLCGTSVDPVTRNPAISLPERADRQTVIDAIARMFS
ncbi:hypothetical protein PMAYCL1PPCAC_05801, partial [Pristionchus mayeri]